MKTKFIKEAFSVTDLNKDNKAEIWIMYTTGCRSDVSTDVMKIIMYEKGKKHAMRGESKVPAGANKYMGGRYIFDNVFKQASIESREYATKLWNKHITGN